MKEYREALHAMQSGVAMQMEHTGEATPKHLRVGVNSAMCGQAALVKLLVEKGLFTMEEYHAAITAEMNLEVGRYEKAISDRTGGANIHLH
jgi:hypothetical protein